jgi:hypothetical protein
MLTQHRFVAYARRRRGFGSPSRSKTLRNHGPDGWVISSVILIDHLNGRDAATEYLRRTRDFPPHKHRFVVVPYTLSRH